MSVVALDVGGTKTLAMIVSAEVEPSATLRLATASGGAGALIAFLVDAIDQVSTAAQIDPGQISAVGVGMPGFIEPGSGVVRGAVNLGLGDDPVPVAMLLERACSVPTTVVNDVDAAALGAAHLLGATDLAYINIGTGVAAGLVLDGRLRQGRTGAAGEIGHWVVQEDGPICSCGQHGCLEVLVARAARDRHRLDRDARELRRVAHHLADAVLILALVVEPEVFVFGGGVVDGNPGLVEAVRDALSEREASSAFVGHLGLIERLRVLSGGESVGAIGAGLVALGAAGVQ
ncbi:MAG: ROK family protein [Ilumatobacteraceae bacterium]